MEYLARKAPDWGGVCVQAESEVAAVNMALGASAAGARTMTSSSSPGISLKTECISYLVGSDLPCVIVNIQRCGPGLGGIQPAQQDYIQSVKALGHGDMKIIALAPSSVQELAEMTALAFDLADIYRTPVMILADGALGQMMEPVDFSKLSKREIPAKDWALTGHGNKRKNNIVTSLYLMPEDLEAKVIERYATTYAKIEANEVLFEEIDADGADIVIVACGISARIARTAFEKLRADGVKAGFFRPITLSPFPSAKLNKIAGSAGRFLTVELNMGQMVDDVRLAVEHKKPVDFFGRTGGMMPAPDEIYDAAMKSLK
jgi:2-oxoglutarate ferredoxin oxidoreductase subunit alpha